MNTPRILIVEDDAPHGEALREILTQAGYQVQLALDADSALDRMGARNFDLVLTDLVLGGRDGLELMHEAKELYPQTSFFLITGHSSVETAVEAMRHGAADYIQKPILPDELLARVAKELEDRQLRDDNQDLRTKLGKHYGMEGMVGASEAMNAVYDIIRRAAPTLATVLLLGESGTGKELVARAVHNLSKRSRGRFVAVNCAALTESLMESELFGHSKGAFTGAQVNKEGKFVYADGGTLFLDEIGDMPLDMQAKLLRVLEDGVVTPVGSNDEIPVDVRIVAATNQHLLTAVDEGKFRQDLYYRLAVVGINLPPLRERLADLPLLTEAFSHEFAEKHEKLIQGMDALVVEQLALHHWPGNVRELRNVLESMVVLDQDGFLGIEDLPMGMQRHALPSPEEEAAPEDGGAFPALSGGQGGYELAGKSLAEVEADLIRATLEATEGNRADAAKQLGMGQRTLYRKLRDYDIS